MEKTYDDLLAISALVQSLTQQLSESSDQVAKLEKIARELVPDYDKLIAAEALTTTNEPEEEVILSPEEQDEIIIKKLEQQRLNILMEIQKEDFLSEKLQELIDQNQTILESIKEYLENKDHIHKEEEEQIQRAYDHYVHNKIQPIIDQLDSNLFDLYTGIHKVQSMLDKEFTNRESITNTLESQEYQETLDSTINKLNEIFTIRKSIEF